MLKTFGNYLMLVLAYARINLNAQLEYRWAFFSEVAGMLINDGFWVMFWVLFFSRFPVLRGWTLQDVITLWAITAAGFGIAYALMGNGLNLASLITNGQLDMWMMHPRAVLPHLLLGKTVATAWGDAAFGYIVYAVVVRPNAAHMALFVLLSFLVAAVFAGFSVLSGSLAFYVGNASGLSDQWRNIVVTFSTYPPTLFDGLVKALLFTAIPAAFVSYLPVQALRSMSLWDTAYVAGGAVLMVAIGALVFHRGLRRYESGNLISMHG